MSDIQDLIHKTTMDSIEKGQAMELERIIRLLEGFLAQLKGDINGERKE